MKLYRNLLENFILPTGDFVLGTHFISALKDWRKVQKLSELELHQLQQQKLSKLLQHAVQNIPFYKEKVSNQTNLNLRDFPVLTKGLIRENTDRMLWHPDK